MKLLKQQLWRENPESILAEHIENHTIVSIIDVIGRIIYANNKFCELIEIPHERIQGELNVILKSERHANPIYKDLWTVIKSGEIWKGTLSDYTNSGKFYRLDTTIIPTRNENGEIDKFVVYFYDAQPKNKPKLKIVDGEKEAKTYYDILSNSVLTINMFAEILNSNQGFGNLSDTEVEGCSLYSFISPIFHDMVKKIIKNVFNNAIPNQFKTIGYNSEGVSTIFVSQIGPVLNNKGVVVSATISTQEVKDVSEVKQELMENEAKYQSIFQSMKVGIIVVVNEAGKVTEWNKGAELAFGYTESEIMGEYLSKLIASKDRKTSIIGLLNAVKTLEDFKTSDTVEMKGLRKNGLEFPLEFALSKWKNRDSDFYCAMMLDITNRKNLENKLKRKTKDLELFLYRSAHDLKAPFSSAEGLLELLREEDINERALGLIDMLVTTLERGKNLSENLIEASIISKKKDDIKIINFHEIIDNVLVMFDGLINYSSINFNVDVKSSSSFSSSPELLNSLFQNLIQNSIEYSKKATPNHSPYIDITIKANQEEVIIKICDNGLGINEKSINKIFDLYFHENNGGVSGNGLGLYIVNNIVEALNGKIEVTSDLKSGTCFEISLPNSNQLNT